MQPRVQTLFSTVLAGFLLASAAWPAHALLISGSGGPTSPIAGALTLDFGSSQINNIAPASTVLPSSTLGPQYSYTGGALFNFDSSSALPQGISARPPGSTGNFWSIGSSPTAQNGLGIISFASGVEYFGFLWGSPDAYNRVSYYDGDQLLGTFDGSAILVPPNGDQSFSRYLNAFTAPGETITTITFASTNNAFESDNHAFIFAVPEPTSLALVGLALGVIGFSRRRKNVRAARSTAWA